MNSSNKKPLLESKIPSKLLIREPSGLSNSSFRVYYGKAAGSVPFLWESQPGTPKHPTTAKLTENDQYALPPLTPPPSYSYSYYSESIKKKTKSHNLLHVILPKLNLRRSNVSYRSLSSSSSSSSCSSSEPSSPAIGQKARQQRAATARLSSPKRDLFSYENRDDKEGSHTLMLCFGARR